MINIRLFRNALMLAEQGNFARAARALGISQPTLTRSIQTLENMLGENLFDRGNKGVSTTQAGEIVLKHARMIIASSEAMKEELGIEVLIEIDEEQSILELDLVESLGPAIVA